MARGGPCSCDTSDPSTDPADYLDALKRKYLDRTAKLQAQQLELEQRIAQMETLLGGQENDDQSGASSCSCAVPQKVPKVFAETPVRDAPAPKILAPINPEQQPAQACSFFQKIMENAKSILSIKCQCASPFVSAKSTSVTPQDATSSFSPSDPPTKENNNSAVRNITEDEITTVTDHSSKTSICTCDDSYSTLQEASCSCNIESPTLPKVPQEQQVSMDSSSTPKNTQDPNATTIFSDGPTTRVLSKDCPYNKDNTKSRNTTTSDLTSSCSCDECICRSSIVDNKMLQLEPDQPQAVPKISVFSARGDNLNAEVQATKPVESRGYNIQVPKDTANKCVTCCQIKSCPKRIKKGTGAGDTVSAGVQVASATQHRSVSVRTPKATLSVACCESKMCSSNKSNLENQCRGSCNLPQNGPNGPYAASVPQLAPVNKCRASCNTVSIGPNGPYPSSFTPYGEPGLKFNACFEKCETTRQDGQNQCAFVGSPLLNSMDFKTYGNALPSNTIEGFRKQDQPSKFSLTSNDIIEMQNIAELAKKEKQMKAQIEELQKREKAYQEVTKDMNTLVTRTANGEIGMSANTQNVEQQIQKISQELRLENQILKSELMDLKVELKHCLEKVEGPMKQKLQTEKQKCECLQQKLQDASKDMLLSQDAYSREMNQLKLQLCCACTNISELNQMNGRLKDEMSQLDCLCAKLEDDLVKQKINEADTIKRLTSRRISGDGPILKQSDDFRCDSSLDVIARKLSNTLKDLAPCNECSTVPPELAGAAKCIKELTDLVRKRKKARSSSSGGCCCNSKGPSKYPSKEFMEEECCTCCGPRDRGDKREPVKVRKKISSTLPCGCVQSKPVSTPAPKEFPDYGKCKCSREPKDGGGEVTSLGADEKAVRTLLSVPESFVQEGISSKFDVNAAASSYYSANGEPVRGDLPCAKIGSPCLKSRGTVTRKEDVPTEELVGDGDVEETGKPEIPCANIGRPCLESRGTITKEEDIQDEDDPKRELPCDKIGKPCQKDKEKKETLDVMIETEETTVDKSCKAPCSEMIKPVKDGEAEADLRPETRTSSEMARETKESETIISREMGDALSSIIDKLPDTIQEVTEQISPSDTTDNDQQDDEQEIPDGYETFDEPYLLEAHPKHKDTTPRVPGQEIPVEEYRFGDPFPVDVEFKAFAIDAQGPLHTTTTVTGSGTLEVITEGPEGMLETVLTYTDDGNIEVVTEMVEFADQKPTPAENDLEKFTSEPPAEVPGVPEELLSSVDTAPVVVDGATMMDQDVDDITQPKLKPLFPVMSSRFSGPSGPETETPYTGSSASGEGELTSKLASGSSGIQKALNATPDVTSATLATDQGIIIKDGDTVSPEGEEVLAGPGMEAEVKDAKSRDETSAYDAVRQDMESPNEALTSEGGVTSTFGEMQSGEIFTPDQIVSDADEESAMGEKKVKSDEDETTADQEEVRVPSASGEVVSDVDGELRGQSEVIAGLAPEETEEKTQPGEEESATQKLIKSISDEASETIESPKVAEPTVDGELPDTSSAGVRKTRDCSCQSKDQKDQSCQCCECKTIGVTTSGDKETITAEEEAMCKTPQEEAKTDTDSEFVTTSEATDNAFVQRPISAGTEVKPLQPPGDWAMIMDDRMMAKHPELANKTSEEQQRLLKQFGYLSSRDKMFDALLQEYPELEGKSFTEQKEFLEKSGYSDAFFNQFPAVPEEGEESTVNEEILAKHPELADMTTEEKQKALKALGYAEQRPELASKSPEEKEQILSSIPKTSSIVIDKDMLENHPELAGKTSEQQSQILKDLGYVASTTAPIKISQDLHEKHPELVGKTPEEQQEILEKHPELADKSPSQQKQLLENLGLLSSQASPTKIDQDLLADQISEQRPEQLLAEPTPQGPIISKEKPSSKEVSVTCKAPCRSAATIHDDSPKTSDKDVSIGDASLASKSVSLQKTPSSRDGSASCKASYRTISVQSSAKEAPVLERSAEVVEPRFDRNESSTTTSSSDSREKEKMKEKEKVNSRQGEVPSIVSQLSDRERPIIEPTKRSKGQRKKRFSKMMDCLKCPCNDPCKCEVCSPEAMKRQQRKVSRPVRSCDCPSPILLAPIQMASASMPMPSHSPNCNCNACIFNSFTRQMGPSRAEVESPTSDENDAKRNQKHSSKCECIDCLCMPKIKKLAETREYPVVYEEKQVYHVKTNCGTCANAQNAKRYVEQQRSRIPISTTSPNPPKPRSDTKPTASTSKIDDAGPSSQGPKVSHSDSIYNSISCDCENCKCADCADPKVNKSKKPDGGCQNDKGCCCQGPCVCKPCTFEELAKKLQEAEAKLAAQATPATFAADAPSRNDHEEECTCPECVTCPQSDLMQKGPVTAKPSENGDEEECTCPECVCPGADNMPSKQTGGGDDDECNCQVCECPGKDLLPLKGAAPPRANEAECDCTQCLCSPCADPKKQKTAPEVDIADCDCTQCICSPCSDPKKQAGELTDYDEDLADCDCVDCKCSPCADPKKAKGYVPRPRKGKAAHPTGCDCAVCSCPGGGDVSKATGVPEKLDHPPDCDCDECLCLEEIIKSELGKEHPQDCDCPVCSCPSATDKGVQPTADKAVHPGDCNCDECKCAIGTRADQEVHALACACPECLCPECTAQAAHVPGCRCDTCICTPCDYKGLGDTAGSTSAGVHPTGCSCIACRCDTCVDPTKPKAPPLVEGPSDEQHGDGCKCVECLCKECLLKLEPLKHDEGCKCAQCTCVECLRTMSEGGVRSSPAPGEGKGDTCECEHCMCIDCGAKAKSTEAKTSQAGGGQGTDCTCDVCDCGPCLVKEGVKDLPCTCGTCTCIECTKKREAGKDGGNCTCVKCECDPCPQKEGDKDLPCTCTQCTCLECTKKREIGTGGGKQKGDDSTVCTCVICQCEPCPKKDGNSDLPCTCPQCICVECTKKREIGMGDKETHSPVCTCSICQCKDTVAPVSDKMDDTCTCEPACTCEEPGKEAKKPEVVMDPPPFEPPLRINCDCNKCECVFCAKKRGDKPLLKGGIPMDGEGGNDQEAPPFEVPVRIDCTCTRCDCVFCTKEGPKTKEMAAQPSKPNASIESKTVSVQPSKFNATATDHAPGCVCLNCICPQCEPVPDNPKATQGSAKVAAPQPSGGNRSGAPAPSAVHCDCPTCTCNEGEIKTTTFASAAPSGVTTKSGEQFQSIETLELPKPTMEAHMTKLHPTPCDCADCRCQPCPDDNVKSLQSARNMETQDSMKKMDNITLAKSIQAANKENCECKEQIAEIKKTLERIKCACTEAEFRSTQSMGQTMEQKMEATPGKPFVKQASVFGQTMSGLKMALANLQAKCKAKDKMIEAMTGELEIRGEPGVFDKVLERATKPLVALDYDQAEDVKSIDRSQLDTNLLYKRTMADQGTAPCDLRCVASKSVEVRTHKHKKKKDGSSSKKLDCTCSKPQIIQKEEKDCQKLDLAGFEVIDIRRITDDSLIVKWNAPKCPLVTGYDIFVNGTLASKVMSGSRTSAMMHSLNLSKSVQITIYSVSKCGRIEPPAIAIYEIKC